MKLIEHRQVENFHHFVMQGDKPYNNPYHLTVIKPPIGFYGEGWGWNELSNEGHFIVINEDRNTAVASYHTYNFYLYYFQGENTDYMPHRIGIHKDNHEDFMKCVKELVYPVLKQYVK